MLLRQMLYRCETGFLPIIAGFWIELAKTPDYEELIRILCKKMLEPAAVRKMLEGPDGADLSAALHDLISRKEAGSAAEFEKKFGTVRIDGIEKIKREKYWLHPVSIAEKLWYRGLIFSESRFLDGELKDVYTVPDDLKKVIRPLLPALNEIEENDAPGLIVRPAVPSETASVLPVDGTITDMVCIAAAMKRSGHPFQIPGAEFSKEYQRFLEMLLTESGFFPAGKEPDTEKIRLHLIGNRTAAELQLIQTWRRSGSYDELRENECDLFVKEDPVFNRTQPRNAVLNMLGGLTPDTWWSLNSFISAVKKADILFLRGCFSQEERGQIFDPDGNDLNGIGSWYQLEGAYIRFLIFGPLYWLGITQTAFADRENKDPAAFRISREAAFYLTESTEKKIPEAIIGKPNLEKGLPNIGADGTVSCSSKVPRYFRYMTARACELEKYKGGLFVFRITLGSLAEAEKNGISREAYLSLLKRFTGKAVPPSLEHLLTAEKKKALPASIYTATVLTVPNGEVLNALLENPRLEKYILQQINPNSLFIDPKGIEAIRRFLMEKEIFVDVQIRQ